MTDLINTRTISTQDGHAIGVITLNNPKALNALNLDMVRAMREGLLTWRDEEKVVAVVIHGAGGRAFCAGGDIKSLTQATGVDDVRAFFEQEYGLMAEMYDYPKPLLAWGHGVVMGGGLGLLSACSHKVVTNETLMAMPEVSIGLFPDAGGSWFLNRMMGKVGLFLGLTGGRFDGVDALYLGLGDAFLAHDDFEKVLDACVRADWQGSDHHGKLSQILSAFHQNPTNPSQIIADFHTINQLMNKGSLKEVDLALKNYQGDSAFISSAIDSYIKGSDTTKAITWRIYHHIKPKSVRAMFEIEKIVATQCVLQGDFKEGVRALLIDKDKNPKWRYTLADMPDGWIDGFFG